MTTTNNVLSVVMTADWLNGPPQGQWTYDDYAKLPDDGNRYEVINGVIYMSPSPSFSHQAASTLFVTYLTIHMQFTGLGRVMAAPFDVYLPPSGTTVQTDIIVIVKAKENNFTSGKFVGTPDLVLEIASPGTAGYDRREKQNAYALAGVAEYWIADPNAQTIEVLILTQDNYRSLGVFQGKDTLPSQLMPTLPTQVEQFFM